MGWRFRKSINLGGGFRINLSKSGIGYSWGVPGYRITKTANGSVRKTYSIPGTGIQYVDSVNNKKTINNIPPVTDSKLIIGDTTYYKNTNLDEMREKDEILKQINQLRNINTIANILIFSMIFLPIGILLKGLIGFIGKIDLNYEFDEFSQKKYDSLKKFFKETFDNNKKVWQIHSSTHVYNTKYNSGASSNITRDLISISKQMPWYIKTNIEVYCFNLKREKIYFTPDRMIIFSGGYGVSGSSYKNLDFFLTHSNFIEEEGVPKDSEIISYTWKYVNKNGGPDKRFSNNRQLPVCRYGSISIKSYEGINILLNCSNFNSMINIQNCIEEFVEMVNNEIASNETYYNFEIQDKIEEKEELNQYTEIQKCEKIEVEKPNEELENKKIESTEKNEKNIPQKENIKIDFKKIVSQILYVVKFIFCSVAFFFSLVFVLLSCIEEMFLVAILWLGISILFLPIVNVKIKRKLKINNICVVILVIISFIVFVFNL